MTRYIAIGDVHGQHRLLHQAIQDLDDGDTFFILLGDLNDSRLKGPAQDRASSLECIRIAMGLMSRGVGVTLQSNHGTYLYRALLGGEILPYSTMGLSHTLQEMNLLPQESQQRVGKWLQGLPYYWTVTTSSDTSVEPPSTNAYGTWYAAHGMWVPGMSQWRPKHEHVQASVYGKGPLGKRAKFWEDQEYIQALPPNTYTISGHYHKVIMEPPCYVIDSNCGSGGSLMGLCLNDLKEYRWCEPYP
jgi:hypothetical protein